MGRLAVVADFERRYLAHHLERFRGSISKTAEHAGAEPRTLSLQNEAAGSEEGRLQAPLTAERIDAKAEAMEQEPLAPQPARLASVKRLFVAGLLVLVPVALTLFVLYNLFLALDGIFAPLLVKATGYHVPGLGLVLTLIVVLVLGWLSTNVLGRQLILLSERVMGRIPVAGSIYGATKGVVEGLAKSHADAFKRVVMVEYPRRGIFAIAFVTNAVRWPDLHERTGDALLLFLPTTPNPTSGYLLVVPRDDVVNLPMTVEDGIKLVISGGILLPRGAPGP